MSAPAQPAYVVKVFRLGRVVGFVGHHGVVPRNAARLLDRDDAQEACATLESHPDCAKHGVTFKVVRAKL